MAAGSNRVSRAESFVLGLMNDAERQRAERDLEIDPVFREAVLEFAGRLQVLDVVPQKAIGGAEHWKLIAARIAALPHMRGAEEGAIVPVRKLRTVGKVQRKWEPVFRPKLRKIRYALPSRQAAVYAISLIAAFAAGYLAALWLM
ncbi:hypothetical protein SAZ10_27495 [Mesorhizobium sp. BAC0120]|uniref:hypothetical protein n=1 Tax=Mesorhizobium sp. BAC0120 TaxID=3090670 RepID=UPI00298CAB2A|nr:hypothetical protein [Mesorhizobium sp. BAC0120]MDW6025513.1 hypothetical protein [Mesorhizobium sp. BAC0120]